MKTLLPPSALAAAALLALSAAGCFSPAAEPSASESTTASAEASTSTSAAPSETESAPVEEPTAEPTPVEGAVAASPEAVEVLTSAVLGDPIEVVEALEVELPSAIEGTRRFLVVAEVGDVYGSAGYVAAAAIRNADGGGTTSRVDASTTQYQNGLSYQGLPEYEGPDAEEVTALVDEVATSLGATPDVVGD